MRKRRIKSRIVIVVFVRLVQCNPIAFHPSVSFHLFVILSNAMRKCEGIPCARAATKESMILPGRRMDQSVQVRGIDMCAATAASLLTRDGLCSGWESERSSFSSTACSETTPSQTQRDHATNHRAQKNPAPGAPGPKSPEPFPHQQGVLGAARYPRAGSEFIMLERSNSGSTSNSARSSW